MSVNSKRLDISELKPRITIFGVGGAGGNAVNNMISAGLQGVDFVVANTDAQALAMTRAERIIQMGVTATGGLGAGSQPDVGRAAAEEVIDEIRDHLTGAHMVFVTAGMGGGTGTGASGKDLTLYEVDQAGVACITDLIVKEGLINLDFADVRAVMREMGSAMMGTGEASGDRRALLSAEAPVIEISTPRAPRIERRG